MMIEGHFQWISKAQIKLTKPAHGKRMFLHDNMNMFTSETKPSYSKYLNKKPSEHKHPIFIFYSHHILIFYFN